MERFVRGDVLVLPFPLTDLSSSIRRPALALTDPIGDDLILCQITSKFRENSDEIEINSSDFKEGKLKVKSYVRPSRILTIHKSLILYKLGSLKREKTNLVVKKLINLFSK